jgi:hypothetical protein
MARVLITSWRAAAAKMTMAAARNVKTNECGGVMAWQLSPIICLQWLEEQCREGDGKTERRRYYQNNSSSE